LAPASPLLFLLRPNGGLRGSLPEPRLIG